MKRKEIVLRIIPKKEARKLIEDYIDKDENQGNTTSDIAIELRLDPFLVGKILNELLEKGEVSNEPSRKRTLELPE